MTRHFYFLLLLLCSSACTTSQKVILKVEQNYHCDECEHYINQVLIPQLKTCNMDMDSWESCKFDSDLFASKSSCLLGMKKQVLNNLIGLDFFVSAKNSRSSGALFWFVFSAQNNRLIEIVNVDIAKQRKSNVRCLDCDTLYKKIKNAEAFRNMSFEKFHERYKGCFYGKLREDLVVSLNFTDQIKETNHYYSYNKTIQFGNKNHEINFLFYPGERIVDISPVDSIGNRVIN